MTSTRRFTCDDLFKFNNINLDPLTETYNLGFYLQYMATWPNYFTVCESPSNSLMGYVMGKAEGEGELWHGHVTAITVGPEFRRLGLAKLMMGALERISEFCYEGYFVDLFVRASNDVAINMYKKMGYDVYQRVIGYYSGTEAEDAFGMFCFRFVFCFLFFVLFCFCQS